MIDQAVAVQQHLRSIVIHSLDTYNYNNAEFACERLLAQNGDDVDSIYLYCLVLFRQHKFKSCYNKLIDCQYDHLGCAYLFARLCLKLKKYKEGIFQLLKVNYLYNDSAGSGSGSGTGATGTTGTTGSSGLGGSKPDSTNSTGSTGSIDNIHYFASPQSRYNYEFNRSIYVDLSSIYHLLADLYNQVGDTKLASLNYIYCLKYNQFDFEAFQKLCRLGVDVKVKALFKPNFNLLDELDMTSPNSQSYPQTQNQSQPTPQTLSVPSNPGINASPNNPFQNISSHGDDSFNLSTPRIKSSMMPSAPLRKLNNTDSLANRFEFTKPNFPHDKKRESTYSRITSRLISQPQQSSEKSRPNGLKRTNSYNGSAGAGAGTGASNGANGANASGANVNGNNPGNNNSKTSNNNNSHTTNETKPFSYSNYKDIENSNNYLLQLYLIFAKSFKCFSKYDCYKAIRILESLSESEKHTPWVLSKLGRLHYEIVNYKQSEYFFVTLRQLDRTRLEDMEYYSTLLWHLHKRIELTYLANELYELDDTSAITWCVIGNLFSLTREPDEAIKCFNKSTKFDEKFTYGYTLKGHEYFGNDNYEMALENFRISLMIDPRHYNALYGIGMVYINLGDYQKADYHFRKAVSINPINVILICCVGMVLEKLGKKNLALRQYELAIKLQPLNPLPMFKKAQLLFTMQQFKQSLQLFEVLKDLAPDEASVHFLLGQLYNLQDDKFQAIREFTIALNLDPKGNYLIREAMESLLEK